jgi:hypothetical protein
MADWYLYFEGICYFHLQGGKPLTLEAELFSETFQPICPMYVLLLSLSVLAL